MGKSTPIFVIPIFELPRNQFDSPALPVLKEANQLYLKNCMCDVVFREPLFFNETEKGMASLTSFTANISQEFSFLPRFVK